jgi:hypothetical protein
MADHFTHFACLLDVGADHVEAALALHRQVAAELEADDGLAIGFSVAAAVGRSSAVLLTDEDSGQPEQVAAFALRCAEQFSLTGRWGFCWAFTCSKARADAFGGGAVSLDLGQRKILAWLDCGQWLDAQLAGGPAPAAAAEGTATGER